MPGICVERYSLIRPSDQSQRDSSHFDTKNRFGLFVKPRCIASQRDSSHFDTKNRKATTGGAFGQCDPQILVVAPHAVNHILWFHPSNPPMYENVATRLWFTVLLVGLRELPLGCNDCNRVAGASAVTRAQAQRGRRVVRITRFNQIRIARGTNYRHACDNIHQPIAGRSRWNMRCRQTLHAGGSTSPIKN
jgi:hypothetical protein